MVSDRGTCVTDYQLDPLQVNARIVPELTALERVYRFAIVPFYTVFPKPGELGNVVSYLLTGQESVAAGPNAEQLSNAHIKLNIRSPLWSSLAFLVAVLAVTCLFIRRADF